MTDFVLYARHEPTNDPHMQRVPKGYEPAPMPDDVVLYRDAECKRTAGRWPWHYSSKPKRSDKRTTLNGFVYRLEWVADG